MRALAERITEALTGKVLTKPELARALDIDPTASPITPQYQAFSIELQELRSTGVIFMARDLNQARVEESDGEFARYYRSVDERGLQNAARLKKPVGRFEYIDLLKAGEHSGVISPKTARNWRNFFEGKTLDHPRLKAKR